MKPTLPVLSLAFLFASVLVNLDAADPEVENSEVTGEIRYPKEDSEIQSPYSFKGRTRGAPDGFVAMTFLACPRAESFFPYGEPGKANRTFSQTIHHRDIDSGLWYVHLYVLPEADAEKLADWHAEAARLVEAGQEKTIKPFDQALMKQAIKVASRKYVIERD